MLATLESLIKLARERKATPIEGSYTNKLLKDKSLNKILRVIGKKNYIINKPKLIRIDNIWMSIDSKFLNLFIKATEKAAIGASKFIGKNDKNTHPKFSEQYYDLLKKENIDVTLTYFNGDHSTIWEVPIRIINLIKKAIDS